MKTLFSALVGAVLVLSGCNVFEGIYEAGTSNNPDVLMADAQQAMQQGEPAKAVEMLEKAVEKTQPNTVQRSTVQVNLATAKMAKADVSVIKLQRMIQDFSDRVEFGKGGLGKGRAFAGEVCSFEAPDQRVEALDLESIDGFSSISSNQAVLAEVQRLVQEALHMTASPGPQFSIQGRIDSLQAAGMAQASIAEALLNAALARVGASYSHIAGVGGDEIAWYRVRSAARGDYYVGYCAPSEAVVQQVKDETACSMSDFAFSVDLLRARSAFYPEGSLSDEIADKAEEGYQKLQQELDGTCHG